MQKTKRTYRRAFTLMEMLVALSTVAVLGAITLPAVLFLKAHAHTFGCVNHLRQTGLASLSFVATHEHLPTEPLATEMGHGWAIDLLTYLEQQALREQFDLEQALDTERNVCAAAAMRPPTYRCPANTDRPVSSEIDELGLWKISPSHYSLNGFVLGRSWTDMQSTSHTMLGRCSGMSGIPWNFSPFTTVFDDNGVRSHSRGIPILFADGSVDVRTNGDAIIVDIDPR